LTAWRELAAETAHLEVELFHLPGAFRQLLFQIGDRVPSSLRHCVRPNERERE
jgi:hypothetical protein